MFIIKNSKINFGAFVHSVKLYIAIKKSEVIYVYIDIDNRYTYGKISKHEKERVCVCVSINKNIHLSMLI